MFNFENVKRGIEMSNADLTGAHLVTINEIENETTKNGKSILKIYIGNDEINNVTEKMSIDIWLSPYDDKPKTIENHNRRLGQMLYDLSYSATGKDPDFTSAEESDLNALIDATIKRITGKQIGVYLLKDGSYNRVYNNAFLSAKEFKDEEMRNSLIAKGSQYAEDQAQKKSGAAKGASNPLSNLGSTELDTSDMDTVDDDLPF